MRSPRLCVNKPLNCQNIFMETPTKSVGLISLGCSKNLVDSEVMLGLLQGAGYRIIGDPETAVEADAIIVNTCGFLGAAVEESLNTLEAVAALKKSGGCKAIVATGCLPQRDAQLIKDRVPEVDAILGTTDYPNIVATLEAALAPRNGRAFVPPQTGGLIQLSVTPREAHTFVYGPHHAASARHAAVDGLRQNRRRLRSYLLVLHHPAIARPVSLAAHRVHRARSAATGRKRRPRSRAGGAGFHALRHGLV